MEGLAGKITGIHESNFACYNYINGITSTADEYIVVRKPAMTGPTGNE